MKNIFYALGIISCMTGGEILCSQVNDQHQDKKGNTPLHAAMLDKYADAPWLINGLVDSGFSLYIRNNKGQSPADLAKDIPLCKQAVEPHMQKDLWRMILECKCDAVKEFVKAYPWLNYQKNGESMIVLAKKLEKIDVRFRPVFLYFARALLTHLEYNVQPHNSDDLIKDMLDAGIRFIEQEKFNQISAQTYYDIPVSKKVIEPYMQNYIWQKLINNDVKIVGQFVHNYPWIAYEKDGKPMLSAAQEELKKPDKHPQLLEDQNSAIKTFERALVHYLCWSTAEESEVLLRSGVSPYMPGFEDKTPVDWAFMYNDHEKVKLLQFASLGR